MQGGCELQSERRGDAADATRCPVCGRGCMSTFWEIRNVPVKCNALCRTREEALAVPRADICLAVCGTCGYICNALFDPSRMQYDQAYENALHYSPHFRAYADDLAKRIIETYDLRGKDILEIACGDGYFLRLLCKLGGNRGVGFDPSYTERPSGEDADANVSIIRDYYGEMYLGQAADLICCRHALEHIPDPIAFLRTVRKTIGDRLDTVVFFEVPNAMFILRDLSVWDIIYEHCCYFTIPSLVRCFRSAGFDVDDVREAYDGQFLTIAARPTSDGKEADATTADAPHLAHSKTGSVEDVVAMAEAFAERFTQKLDSWAKQFTSFAAGKRKAVLWGAGSKGITILNMLRGVGGTDCIEYVVDINNRKHGKFVAGTGQEIVPPEFLQSFAPDAVIVMNPVYRDEVDDALARLGARPELVVA